MKACLNNHDIVVSTSNEVYKVVQNTKNLWLILFQQIGSLIGGLPEIRIEFDE